MADNQTNVQTSVQQLDVDIDSLFDGAPRSEEHTSELQSH